MKFFEGCTALITGASAGLGVEFARQLAPYANTLVLVARRNDRLEQLRSDLMELFPELKVLVYSADLSDESQRSAFINWLGENHVDVNFLINNAGLGDHGSFAESDWERVRAMLNTNIHALTHLTHALVPRMLAGDRGAAVLNVSSVAGFFPLPNFSVYSATKAFVTSFSESLAMELKPHGISVTALCPGPVPTEFFEVASREGAKDRQPHHESMSLFATSPAEVVYTGLRGVIRERTRVVPNPLLCFAVGAALLVPFFITRKILSASASRF
ncbi:MAG: SDR family NAD(P)-dependent oxidoreductase [Chthoniobacterales bacterium]